MMSKYDRTFGGGLYRSRNGMLLGVCRGIAEHFDFSVFAVRLITFFLFIFSGIWPLLFFYLLAAFIMKPEPVIPLRTEEECEFYDSYMYSRKSAAHRLSRRYRDLERRIQRMEDTVTDREFTWDDRL